MTDVAIPDYDQLPIGDLTGRLRTLDLAALIGVEQYERAHAGRVHVLQLIAQRRAELEGGAEPSGGDPAAANPATGGPAAAPAPAGDTGVSPQTQGPKINPPSQGVPSNPAQPRG
jgi:hypothetical protein